MFWPIIVIGTLVLSGLFFREVWLLVHLPKEHPERGLYWFNVLFLLMCVTGLIVGSRYLDARKKPLEALLPPYPGALFAPDRSVLNGGTIWIYTSDANEEDIVGYYREYVKAHERTFMLDRSDKDLLRMRIGTERAPVFLTVLNLGGTRELDYSFEGRVEMATVTPKQ